MEAYCLKCRTKSEMQDDKQMTMKNGKQVTEGKCPLCGNGMFKIGKDEGAGRGAGRGSGGGGRRGFGCQS